MKEPSIYACILADPPWPEAGGGKIKRGADRHYKLMKPTQILATMLQCPLWAPADNAHLWLWVTNNYLPDGLWLMNALGFRYVTNVAWAKAASSTYQTTTRGVRREPQLETLFKPQPPGLGQYIAGQHELLLFGVRGRLPALWKQPSGLRRPGTLLLAPRREHSAKPVEAYTIIESVSPGPRLEMFARNKRPGWTSWGDEVKRDG